MVRCEPLAAMLDGCMRESQQEEIPMPDQRYDVFMAFLEFLYTDQVQVCVTVSGNIGCSGCDGWVMCGARESHCA